MSPTAVVGDAFVRVRVFSAGLSGDIADNVRRQLRGADRDIDREGERTGDRLGNSIRRGVQNNGNRRGIGNAALALAKDFEKNFNLGIGAARMGRGLISVLLAATPSVAAAAASMATALVSEIVTVFSAIGPGLIGLGAAIGAGFVTAALNFGLLYAAFKSGLEAITELKKEAGELLKELGTPVAEGMVQGLRDAVSTLRGALPELNDLLKTTGQKFGEIAKSAAETLVSAGNLDRIKSILQTNNDFLDRFKNGFNDLITAFLILVNAAKPFIDYLGQGLEKFGAWAKSLLEAKESSGGLATSAQNLLDRWKLLWQTIKDFASGIGNIFSAISPLGESLAQSMADVAANFKAWTGDEGNQSKVLDFFTKAHELSSKIFEVLGKLFAAGGASFMNADFTNLFAVLDSIATKLGPALAQIFNQIQEAMGPHLVAIVDNLGTAFQKIADNQIIGKAAEQVGTLLEKLSELAASDIGSWVLGLGVAWSLFGGVLNPVVGLVKTLVGAFSPLAAAVVAVVGFMVLMWQNSENLREKLGALVEMIGGKFTEIWDKVGPKISELWDNITKLAGAIGDRLAPVIGWLTPLIGDFLSAFGDVASFFIGTLSEAIGAIADLLQGDFSGAWEHVKNLLGGFVDFVKNIFSDIANFIYDLWPGLWDWIGTTASNLWNNFTSFVSDQWNEFTRQLQETGDGLRAWWDNLWAWVGEKITQVWDWITNTLSSAWNGLVDLAHFLFDPWIAFFAQLWDTITSGASTAWTWFTDTLSSIWNGLVNLVHFLFDPWIAFFSQLWTEISNIASTVWNAITSFLSTVWNAISSTAQAVWNGISNFFSSVWNAISNVFTSVVNSISNFLAGAWNAISSTASSIWNGIVGIASSVWNSITGAIRSAVDTVSGWLAGIWEDIKGTADSIWNSIAGIASSAWSAVKDAIIQPIIDAYNTVVGWIEDIKSAVSGALEWLGGKVTEANDKLNDIIGKQAEAGTVTANIFNADAVGGTPTYLAEGGIVPAIPGGWNVVIGEAGRSERVEPLDANGLSARDKAMISRIVGEMVSNVNTGGDTIVKVVLDGRELTGVIQNVVVTANRALARDASRRRRVTA